MGDETVTAQTILCLAPCEALTFPDWLIGCITANPISRPAEDPRPRAW
jgi:hypothetical protein